MVIKPKYNGGVDRGLRYSNHDGQKRGNNSDRGRADEVCNILIDAQGFMWSGAIGL